MIRARALSCVPLLCLIVMTAACGVKSGVAHTGDSKPNGAASSATGDPATATTAAPIDNGATPTTAITPESGGTPGTDGTATTTSATPTTVPSHVADSNDRTGVTDDEIIIGIHAPITGASPIPQDSFDAGKDVYWKYLAAALPDQLFGRTVRVVIRDDQFNPNEAVRVCRELVEQEHVFMLIGAGGADQITACAKYANDAGVPYLSAGGNEKGLDDLSTYFATTLSFLEQAPLVVDQAVQEGLTRVALVIADTPTFAEAHDGFVTAIEAAGLDLVLDTPIGKSASPPEALSIVQDLKNADAQAVIILVSPVVFVTGLAVGAEGQGFDPLWLGVAPAGVNAVLTFGCPSVGRSRFPSAFPGLDLIDQLDPDFRTAYARFAPDAKADDVGLGLWTLNKALAIMFAATGPDLGRAAFMNTLESGQTFDNGIYPPITFTADDHFGGSGEHILQANCDTKMFDTRAQFVAGG